MSLRNPKGSESKPSSLGDLMNAAPELLLSVDREVTWLGSRGTLRRVSGPMLMVPPGESLTWFDPLDGRPHRGRCARWE